MTQSTSDHHRLLVFFLWRQNWSIAQIAARTEFTDAAVVQILHEPPPDHPSVFQLAALNEKPRLRVRLTGHAQKLQIWLPPDDLRLTTQLLLRAIQEECSVFHLDVAFAEDALRARMRTWVYGTWLTVLEASEPQAEVPPQVQLVGLAQNETLGGSGAIVPICAGTLLARLIGGKPGSAGRDLLGRPIPAPAASAVNLPRGDNTVISADGRELLAAADGMAVMREGTISVLPRTVHMGDLTGENGPLRPRVGVIVTGSVREQGVVHAGGDVNVLGQVHSSQVSSAQDSVVIGGAVIGTPQVRSSIRSAEHINCGTVSHTDLQAGRDITVTGKIHHSTVITGGDLYLQGPLSQCLIEVELSVGGGIYVPYTAFPPPIEFPPERRHTRIPTTLTGQFALYDRPPMQFNAVLLLDLSPGGARCRFPAHLAADLQIGRTVEVKAQLPDHSGDLVVIGTIARLLPPSEVGIAFTQLAERDAKRVTIYCMEEMRALKDFQPGSVVQRRTAS